MCNITINFLKKWIKYIDDVEPKNCPLYYGQILCYYTYKDFKNKVKLGSVPRCYIAPQILVTDIIWNTNTTKGKTKNL